MKAIIRKELREGLKLAVPAFILFSLMLTHTYRTCTGVTGRLSQEMFYGNNYQLLQPLASPMFVIETGFFCAIFAALLGWLQIFNERQRDLWAFLVHRPTTRDRIFLGKTIAGLGLYATAAGLPLVVFAAVVMTPGHVAAPFECAMLLPAMLWFLTGAVCYFGGMLTGLRQARWYATRTLGLGLPALVLACVAASSGLWHALVLVLAGASVMIAAARGAFHSNGFYEGQSTAGKPALTAALTCGFVGVIMVTVALLATVVIQRSFSWSYYTITKDGLIYKIVMTPAGSAEITDLDGKPLKDPKTGRPMELTEFNRDLAQTCSMGVDLADEPMRRRGISHMDPRFQLWRATSDTIWYFWERYGRLVGFDIQSRRIIGSIGPSGFSKALAGDRFEKPLNHNDWSPGHSLQTRTSLYAVDLDARTTSAFFTAPAGDRIGGGADVLANGYNWNYTAIVTRHGIHLVKPDGTKVWMAPYSPGFPAYDRVQVSLLSPPDHFAVWISPSTKSNEAAHWTLPTHVTWVTNQAFGRSVDLPELERNRDRDLQENLMASLMPPILALTLPFFEEQRWPEQIDWTTVLISLGMAVVVCAPMSWVVGRRYHFSLRSRVSWALFHVFTGLPGLLAFLSVHDWPARESCPICKKLRVVNRQQCEHCGSDFAPPEKIGVEIFEPISG